MSAGIDRGVSQNVDLLDLAILEDLAPLQLGGAFYFDGQGQDAEGRAVRVGGNVSLGWQYSVQFDYGRPLPGPVTGAQVLLGFDWNAVIFDGGALSAANYNAHFSSFADFQANSTSFNGLDPPAAEYGLAGAQTSAGGVYVKIVSVDLSNMKMNYGNNSNFISGDFSVIVKESTGEIVPFTFTGVDGKFPQAGYYLPSSSAGFFAASPYAVPTANFDAAPISAILWRNDNGAVATWQMDQNGVSAAHFLNGVPTDWQIAGTGDFDGDGHADILWLNNNGALVQWQMASSAGFGAAPSAGTAPSNSFLAGIGDIDGDSEADVLWRNNASGAVTIWKMDGAAAASTATASGVGNDWKLVGFGDLNGDGKADVLFRNAGSGVVAYWSWPGNADPMTATPSTTFLNGVPLDWHVVGMGDFDGNTTTDILWHNDNGANAVWLMGSNGQVQQAAFFTGVSSNWHVAATGDYNGDAKDDVLWRSDNGATAIWQMNGAGAPVVKFPGGVPTDWTIQTHHYEYV
jgi:hypothetical protein